MRTFLALLLGSGLALVSAGCAFTSPATGTLQLEPLPGTDIHFGDGWTNSVP